MSRVDCLLVIKAYEIKFIGIVKSPIQKENFLKKTAGSEEMPHLVKLTTLTQKCLWKIKEMFHPVLDLILAFHEQLAAA